MINKNILVVEDDEDVLELLRYNLTKNGYDVITAMNGEVALLKAKTVRPDFIVLDLMLPGIDGLQVCKELKIAKETKSIPVIMLTAKSEDLDVISGFDMGADDYMTKPFSPKVLVARIKRRLNQDIKNEKTSCVKTHEIIVDPDRRQVLVDSEQIDLSFNEFNLLYSLAKRPGLIFTTKDYKLFSG